MAPGTLITTLVVAGVLLAGTPADRLLFRFSDDTDARAVAGRPFAESRFAWKSLEKGLDHAAFSIERSDSTYARVHTLRFDPDRFGFRVIGGPGPGARIEELLPAERCVAGINGSYFYFKDTLGTRMPLGLTVIGGRRLSGWKKNYSGAFSATGGRAALHYRSRPPEGAESALQSFPMLLWRGRLADALRDSLSGKIGLHRRHRRSAVATDGRSRVYFLVSINDMDFLELAAVMQALGCSEALALDGGASTQMAAMSSDTLLFRGFDRVPVAIGAFRR